MPSFRSAYPGKTFGWPDLTTGVDFHLATGDDSQRATSGDYRPAIDTMMVGMAPSVDMRPQRWPKS
jgi:hypothetical protein